MTEENPLTIAELGAYTNNSMNREGIKHLVDTVNNLGDVGDFYTKAETNALLADKQDVLTAGDNITIENNVISAAGGGSWTLRTPSNNWSDIFEPVGSAGGIAAKKDVMIYSKYGLITPFYILKDMSFESSITIPYGRTQLSNNQLKNYKSIGIAGTRLSSSYSNFVVYYNMISFATDGTTVTLTESSSTIEYMEKSDFIIYVRE